VARLAVAVFYVGLAVILGVLYSWAWAAVILLVGLIPGLALALAASKGGEFLAEMSRYVYDRRYRGRR
jgi:hypothetical protein